MENELIVSYIRHDETGNYIAKYDSQEIVVLPGAFQRVTGVSLKSNLGSQEVGKHELSSLGFIVRR